MKIYEYDLVRTCFENPEQYDVYNKYNKIVGYLRLKHGQFIASYLKDGGEVVYASYPDGNESFEVYERMHELTKAIECIHAKLVIEDKI